MTYGNAYDVSDKAELYTWGHYGHHKHVVYPLFIDTIGALKRHARVLDIGAGPGHLELEFAKARPADRCSFTLLDSSVRLLELARQRLAHLGGRIEYAAADYNLDGWEQGLGGYDAIVSNNSLFHVNPDRLGGCAQDLLRPPGRRWHPAQSTVIRLRGADESLRRRTVRGIHAVTAQAHLASGSAIEPRVPSRAGSKPAVPEAGGHGHYGCYRGGQAHYQGARPVDAVPLPHRGRASGADARSGIRIRMHLAAARFRGAAGREREACDLRWRLGSRRTAGGGVPGDSDQRPGRPSAMLGLAITDGTRPSATTSMTTSSPLIRRIAS